PRPAALVLHPLSLHDALPIYRHVAPLLSDRSARQKLDHAVPDSLVHVVLKAMALRPDDRFATVKKLQADVAAYQSGFATSAEEADRKSTRLNSSHEWISYAVF